MSTPMLRTFNMTKINIAYSAPLLQQGYKQYIDWDYSKAPHAAIQGPTGSGKTYLLKLILARIAKSVTNCNMTICDYKGDNDFSFLSGAEHFYRYDDCLFGLNQFYDRFLQTQKQGNTNATYFLIWDEWASFLNNLDKKDAADAKKKLSSLLMLGRSFRFFVILSQQRMDAAYFESARDNFNLIIALGNISKELKEMFFSSYKDQITDSDRTQGNGYMMTCGTDFQKIVVPQIPETSMLRINETIRKVVE